MEIQSQICRHMRPSIKYDNTFTETNNKFLFHTSWISDMLNKSQHNIDYRQKIDVGFAASYLQNTGAIHLRIVREQYPRKLLKSIRIWDKSCLLSSIFFIIVSATKENEGGAQNHYPCHSDKISILHEKIKVLFLLNLFIYASVGYICLLLHLWRHRRNE